MAVTVVGAYGEARAYNDATPVTLIKPAGVLEGDLMIAVHMTDVTAAEANMGAPVGWVKLDGRGLSNAGVCQIWTKTATASEPANYAFTDTTANSDSSGGMVVVRGHDATNPYVQPITVTAVSVLTTTSHVAPTRTGANGGLLVVIYAGGHNATNAARTFTTPAGMTEQFDTNTTYSGWVALALDTQALASTAATGTRTATSSAGCASGSYSVVIAPSTFTTQQGTFTATATPTISVAAPSLTQQGSVSMTATPTVSVAAPKQTFQAAVTMTATPTITATGFEQNFAVATLTATPTITVTATRTVMGAAVSMTATPTLTATGFEKLVATANLIAVPTFAASSGDTVLMTAVPTITIGAVRLALASVAMSMTPTFTVAAPTQTHTTTANLTATPTITVAAIRKVLPTVAMTATATFNTPSAVVSKIATVTMTATATFGATATIWPRAQLIATPTMTIDTLRTTFGVVNMIATPELTSPFLALIRPVPLRTIYARPPINHPFRLIAQRILDGVIVDWDLPVGEDFEYTRQLSGPTVMKGSFKPEIISVQELNLDGYAYWFHVEIDNEIRASAIFLPPQYQESALSFACEGVSSVPHYLTFEAEYTGIGLDPLAIVRAIWTHVQAQPRSNLNVSVSGNTSPVKLGKAAYIETIPPVPPATASTTRDVAAAPYEMMWWDAVNCGSEIDTLAQQTPFDYVESSTWNSTKTNVVHFWNMGYPRVGTQRGNLLFDEENIMELVPVQESEDSYASAVMVIGAGEGRDTIRGYASGDFGSRIRKTHIVTDKTITTTQRANSVAAAELGVRRGRLFEIGEIVIRANHPNAPLGSYELGDDIPVKVDIPWLMDTLHDWYRITSITFNPSKDRVRLGLARSNSFNYPVVT